jgi:phosphate transport system substrate-binding protein
VQTLTNGQGEDVARFKFRTTNTDEGFADMIAFETDMVMSVREVRPNEVSLAAEVALGRLDDARQSRIVGIDALVPVVSARSDLTAVSLADLAAAYAGDPSALDPVSLHLGALSDGQTQRFTDDVIAPVGQVSDQTIRYDTQIDLAQVVLDDADAIGILPFTDVGMTQPIALRDAGGFTSAPGLTTLKTEDYPLTAPMFLYLPSRQLPSLANEFLAWLRGPQAQLVVRRSGLWIKARCRSRLMPKVKGSPMQSRRQGTTCR